MKNEYANMTVPSPPCDSDGVLAQRMKGGDEAALEDLIQKHAGKVYSLALRYTGNPQDAEEALQDTFLKVFTRIVTFRGEASLSSWLYKITVNTALMKLRERRKRRESATASLEDCVRVGDIDSPDTSLAMQLADRSPDAEDVLVWKERGEIARIAIDKLPDRYRSVVQLKDVDGLSLEEVAEIVEVSIPAVKSRLHRGRQMILKMVTAYMELPRLMPGYRHLPASR